MIINAGDADREGEIIVRLCVNKALHTPKKFMRLWLPDQTDETVRSALEQMKDEANLFYDAGEGWKQIGTTQKLYFRLDHFTGCRFGLFIYSTEVIGGKVTFSEFVYENSD